MPCALPFRLPAKCPHDLKAEARSGHTAHAGSGTTEAIQRLGVPAPARDPLLHRHAINTKSFFSSTPREFLLTNRCCAATCDRRRIAGPLHTCVFALRLPFGAPIT